MSPPLRYCLVSFEYPPETGFGGIGTYVRHMAQVARICDMEVTVLAGSAGDGRSYTDRGVRVHRLAATGSGPGWYRRVASFLARHDFDWVEDAEFGASTLLSRLAGRRRARVHVRLHGSHGIIAHYEGRRGPLKDLGTRLLDRLEAFSTRGADLITAPGASARMVAGLRWGIPDERIGVYPNPFRPEPLPARRPGDAPQDPYILYFGRLQRLKHCDLLWSLASDAAVAALGLRWLLVGRDLCGIEARVGVLDPATGPAVTWMDHVRDRGRLLALMRDASLIFLPSRYESFGYTVLEALSMNPRTVVLANTGPLEIMTTLGLCGNVVDEAALRAAPARVLGELLDREYPGLAVVRGRIESCYAYEQVAPAFRACLA